MIGVTVQVAIGEERGLVDVLTLRSVQTVVLRIRFASVRTTRVITNLRYVDRIAALGGSVFDIGFALELVPGEGTTLNGALERFQQHD